MTNIKNKINRIKNKINRNRLTKSPIIGLIKDFSYRILESTSFYKPKYVPIHSYENMVERESAMYKISKEDIILNDAYFENTLRNELDEIIKGKPLTKRIIETAYFENDNPSERYSIYHSNFLMKKEDLRSRTKYEELKNKISMLNNSVLYLKMIYCYEKYDMFHFDVDYFKSRLTGFINGEYFQHEKKLGKDYTQVRAIFEAQYAFHKHQSQDISKYPSKINNIPISRDEGNKIFNKYYNMNSDRHYSLLLEKERKREEKYLKKNKKKIEKSKRLVDKLLG